MKNLNGSEIFEVSGGGARSDCLGAVRGSMSTGTTFGAASGALAGTAFPGFGTAVGGFLGGAIGGLGAGAYTIRNNPSCISFMRR